MSRGTSMIRMNLLLSEDKMFECFHCLMRSVIWQADFDPEDYGMEGEGIVHTLHCSNCGADIVYYVPANPSPDEQDAET